MDALICFSAQRELLPGGTSPFPEIFFRAAGMPVKIAYCFILSKTTSAAVLGLLLLS